MENQTENNMEPEMDTGFKKVLLRKGKLYPIVWPLNVLEPVYNYVIGYLKKTWKQYWKIIQADTLAMKVSFFSLGHEGYRTFRSSSCRRLAMARPSDT